jgi:sodium-dependent dicarboxylate transporter 2/3/5
MATIGRIAGPSVALLIWILPQAFAGELTIEAQRTAAIASWVAIWWMTEAVPLPVTAMLPIILYPLANILTIEKAAAPYANQYVFLLLGGFMIARAMERWNLHRRIALVTVLAVGTQPRRLVAGFMLATALVSMWISNTASAVMMLPIGLSLVALLGDQLSRDGQPDSEASANFATCLMLGIAYAASIGGVSTLVGTPTNLLLLRYAEQQGIDVGFAGWLGFAGPLALVILGFAWLILTRVAFPIRVAELPGGRRLILEELRKMGPVARAEWTVLAVFVGTATAWVLRKPLTNWEWLLAWAPAVQHLNDTIIALIAATLLFVLPVDARRGIFALDWKTAVTIPWGVLLLFGGGFSLAEGITASRLADWIGSHVATMSSMPTWALVVIVVAMVVFLTELTSNTPTAAVFLPILYGVATGMGVNPMLFLVPATIAASCAFMLPVATPPNAIVFGSGHVTIREMSKAGFFLNLLSVALIPIWVLLFGSFG